MSQAHVHIGEVVTRTGLSHRTIRYYEEMGLLTPSARTEGGFRLYGEADIERLLLIKPMKPMGFSVEEMRLLVDALDVLADPDASAADSSAARAQLDAIHEDALTRVAELKEATARAEAFTQQLTQLSSPAAEH
ncbi:MerR family transcriptional regulator [Janibacter cremeus]|uniref:MerR family transcriptional regulator n=1 Tax=Janibacter cremeus TaxID=1285192 RepID=UPI0023F7449B|nr:MerR family transcriptional regulator [Janibacter cremeus]WEV77006.1 MerR family transcriptional regulator [Janibacter cremeus]